MTENEAKVILERDLKIMEEHKCLPDGIEATRIAIKALEEIQQYRASGTVEELRTRINDVKTLSKMYEELSDREVKEYRELKEYKKLVTIEELREAMEKQRAKKPKTILRHRGGFETEHCPNCDTDYQVDRRYTINDDYCPSCGKLLDSSFKNFCGNCEQAIDWSEEE